MVYKGNSYKQRHGAQPGTPQTPAPPPPQKKKRKRKGIRVFIALFLILILSSAAFIAWLFLGPQKSGPAAPLGLFEEINVSVPFAQTDNILAISVNAPQSINNNDACREYFAPAFEYARQNGINTIILNAKSGLSVFWRDKNFPSFPAILQNDKWNDTLRFDPLYTLCEMAAEADIQLWLGIDAYAAAGYTYSDKREKSPAARLAKNSGAAAHTRFLASDEEFNALLLDSLSELPKYYGFSALYFYGIAEIEDGALAINSAEFKTMLSSLRQNWAANGYTQKIALAFNAELYSPATDDEKAFLTANADYILPNIQNTRGTADALENMAQAAPLVAVLNEDDTVGTAVFTAAALGNFKGLYAGSYEQLSQNPKQLSFAKGLITMPAGTALPSGFAVPQTLNVTYPVPDSLTWEGVYLTGTSNPAEPLYLNGTEVHNRAYNGAFGIYAELSLGQNTFTFTNGDANFVKEIERLPHTGTGGGSSSSSDGSKTAPAGQAIRFNRPFNNVISDPNNSYSIAEIYNSGAVAVVKASTRTKDGTAWAYQLGSGDYVLARNVELIDGDGKSSFSGLYAQPHENGEYIHFEGSGTPGAYIALMDDGITLRITMYDTEFTLADGFASELVDEAWLETNDKGGTVLYLKTNNLWGYNIEYADGGTKIFIKRAPVISSDEEKPLTGVHVLLDPGHGEETEGSNYGALGIAGVEGYPHEKDLNLALAQATAYRLRQLGATVSFTKEDDSNPGIWDRYNMQLELKPDFFLSLHHDGLDGNRDLSENGNIFGIYYHPYNTPPSKNFAQNLMDNISAATGRSAEEKPRWGGINYGVIRTTVCPSVLFEYGLIVTPEHFDSATSADGMYAAALATAQAIIDTIESNT